MKENMDKYNIWLTQVFGTADPKIHEVIATYGSPKSAYEALTGGDHSALTPGQVKNMDYVTMDKVERLILYCEKRNISICSLGSKEYPKLLAEIYDPPVVLYYRGDLSCLDELSLTFVGAREATAYTQKLCTRITKDMCSLGITLVSGMAHGVDECVHTACVKNEAKTVGVLACGIEYDYPYKSKTLREKILLNGGAYISELLPNTPPSKEYFNPRNRILAGLSRGTAVFQASVSSGSLITASYALDEGRDVFCVPPPKLFSPVYEGVISFLEDGAIPIFNHDDILKEYVGLYL